VPDFSARPCEAKNSLLIDSHNQVVMSTCQDGRLPRQETGVVRANYPRVVLFEAGVHALIVAVL
jgi:hypothetical protein